MLVYQSVWCGLVQPVLIGPRDTGRVRQPTHCTARLATLFSVGGLLIPGARPHALAARPAAVSPTEAAASSPFAAFGHRADGRTCNTKTAVGAMLRGLQRITPPEPPEALGGVRAGPMIDPERQRVP
jgi:hypothetical protein